MKRITFSTDAILPQLAQVVRVVNAKNPIQILGSVLFETFDEGRQLLLTSSDGELWLQMKASLIEGDSDMKFCIESKQILQTLRGLSGRTVTLEFEDGKNTCTGIYDKGHFSLPYENAEDYPTIPAMDGDLTDTNIYADRLQNAIGMTEYAVSNDELRPQMNGVHFDFFKDRMVSAASDGHKLAKFTHLLVKKDDETKQGFTLGTKASHLLIGLLQKEENEVKLVFNERMMSVTNGTFKLTSRLIEGRYPNYDSVIPNDNNIEVSVNKAEIMDALKRVLPLGSATTQMVVLNFSLGSMVASSENIDFSTSASETISCDYNGTGFKIAFNGGNLLQILQTIPTDKVNISLKEPSSACVISPYGQTPSTEYIALLMPLMLND